MHPQRRSLLVTIAVCCVLAVACSGVPGAPDGEPVGDPSTGSAQPSPATGVTTTATESGAAAPSTATSVPPTTLSPVFDVRGTVTSAAGVGLAGASVTAGGVTATTDASGVFTLAGIPAGRIDVGRPGWLPGSIDFDGSSPVVSIALEPRVVRALRVSRFVAPDPEAFAALLDLADATTVNALVFDTKDESGSVLYETSVAEAHAIGAVDVKYDPIELLSAARYRDLYTITRIVSFEDDYRADARRDLKLAGDWMDPTDRGSWEYPLDLAVEACEIGFDEVQFDYVRFPTSAAAGVNNPRTQEERTAAISSFLEEARSRLHPLGCAVSAAIFGIVLSSSDDQGIGQRPENLAGIIDAVSPMLYPSHYSDGWLGFADPNDHPGPVIADALDDGASRFGPTIMRPWLQAFYYTGGQVLAQIDEAEARGFGWILWNAKGNYDPSWLPPLDS